MRKSIRSRLKLGYAKHTITTDREISRIFPYLKTYINGRIDNIKVMEIKERYVSFEVAKLLKDKGFSQKCRDYYLDGVRYTHTRYTHTHDEVIPKDAEIVECPTQQMACDWVAYKYDVDIDVYLTLFNRKQTTDSLINWLISDDCSKESVINNALLHVLKNDLKRQ